MSKRSNIAVCVLVCAIMACTTTPKRVVRIDPTIQLRDLSGGKGTFPAVGAGRVVVLDLWASWCQSCRVELPKLQRLASQLSGKQLLVVAINVGEDEKTALSYAKQLKLTLPIYLDPKLRFANSVGARQFPTILVLDRDGAIVLRTHKLDAQTLRTIRERVGVVDKGK